MLRIVVAQTWQAYTQGVRLLGMTWRRVLTTSKGLVSMADVQPAQSAEAVCTPRISEALCGTSAGLAPRHPSTCRQLCS